MTEALSFVPWQDIATLLAPVPGRRQPLAGFDADYVDIVDYIVRCTHRIWEAKNLDLIRTHYSDDCVIHTLGGESHGIQSVIDNTMATLQGFPDRVLFADHVIWSGDQTAGFLSSHRITSHMTHLGDNDLGSATNRRATVTTIADCAVRANRIYEEWLVRDNYALLMQLGIDPERVARQQADKDARDSAVRQYWRQEAADTRAHATAHLPITCLPEAGISAPTVCYRNSIRPCAKCRRLPDGACSVAAKSSALSIAC
jgi:hypothetical protein